MGTLLEQAIVGVETVSILDANTTIAIANGASSAARNFILTLSGTLTANRTLTVPTVDKPYIIHNATSGGYTVTVKTAAGTGIDVPNGQKRFVYADSTNVNDAISSVGNFTVNGNQSITGTLNVTGAATFGSTFTVGTRLSTTVDGSNTFWIKNSLAAEPANLSFGYTTNGSGTVLSSFIATNSATRFHIDSSGRIGIGTTSPAYRLDSNGTGKFTASSAGSDALILQSPGSSSYFTIAPENVASSAVIGYYNGSSWVALYNPGSMWFGGNVGIGTTSPAYSLHVNGNTTATNFIIGADNAAAAGTVGHISNGPGIQFWGNSSGASGSMIFTAGGAERMRMNSSGNIGIGTASPSSQLHLTGALTYGGVTLSAAVVGTGAMVLANSPTLTGTVSAPLFNSTNSYQFSGAAFATRSGGYTILYDGSTRETMFLGGTGDPTNYYRNSVHYFQTVAGGSNMMHMSSTLITIPIAINYGGVTLSNAVTGTGSMVLSNSPALTGSPTAPTQSAKDNSTKIATTAYVDSAIPSGVVLPYAGTVAPSGFLLAYGQVVAQASYPSLYAAIGTTYNTGGEGAGNFRLPDYRGVAVAGKSDMGGSNRGNLTGGTTLGAQLGAETVTLTAAQQADMALSASSATVSATISDPTSIVNTTGGGALFGTAGGGGQAMYSQTGGGTVTGTANLSGIVADGGGQPHANVQPTIVQNYIIKI